MKKLMFAAAAIAAGIAVADVTSANVVGYQNVAVPESGSFAGIAPTFCPVTDGVTGTIKLGEIKPVNFQSATSLMLVNPSNGGTRSLTFEDVEPFGWDADYFAYMSEEAGFDGTVIDAQFFYTEGDGGEGWYLMNDGWTSYNMNDWAISYGEGFIVNSADDDASLQFSGQVNQANYNFPVPPSGTFGSIANPCPVAKTLADFVPVDFQSATSLMLVNPSNGGTRSLTFEDVEPFGWDADYFAYMSEEAGFDGTVIDAQFYYTEGDGGEGWYLMNDGWNSYIMNDWVVGAGETLIVNSADDDASITLPKAL